MLQMDYTYMKKITYRLKEKKDICPIQYQNLFRKFEHYFRAEIF